MRFLGLIALFYAVTCAVAWNPAIQREVVRRASGDSLDDFWDKAQKVGPQAGEVILSKVTDGVAGASSGVTEFKDMMDQLIDQAREIRLETMGYLELHGMDAENFFETLASELGVVYAQLEKEVVQPLPDNHSERAEHREKLAKYVLEKIRPVYIKLLSQVLPQEQAEAQFDSLAPKIIRLVVITGKFLDEHPIILTSIVFAASMLLLPEVQILRPILSIFGFGPLGPIKGSTAAWAQSRFWGAAVESGSWFSVLQEVGMTLTGSQVQKIAANAALATILGLAVTRSRSCCN